MSILEDTLGVLVIIFCLLSLGCASIVLAAYVEMILNLPEDKPVFEFPPTIDITI